jgi:predicted DNA binding protein
MYEYQDKNEVFERVLPIVEKLFESNSLYQTRLNKTEMVQLLVDSLEKLFSLKEIRAINNEDLTKRIDSILVLEAVSGTLNDLTPEQLKIFDEAVEGR